jgi:hypothetical protein
MDSESAMSDLTDRIREAVQAVIDAEEGQGWTVAQWVVAMGLERILSDGTMEGCSWYLGPPEQADWITAGLLEAALETRAGADLED